MTNVTKKPNEVDFLSKSLRKWPGMLVVGDPISPAQAEEILIRTANFYFSTNDAAFKKQLYKALELTVEDGAYYPTTDSIDKAIAKYSNLSLEYLNNSQVVSSYVGGPHGWCNWDGKLFCNNINIGKWPSVGMILAEWKMIASAFPFLELKSQLLNGSICEKEIFPVVQFNISKGKAVICELESEFITPPESDAASLNFADLFVPGRERGCTINQFKHALKTTLNSLK